MKCLSTRVLLAAAMTSILFTGCGRKTAAPEKTYPAAAVVEVGALAYSINGVHWSTTLQGEHGPRVPKDKFLVLSISATNKLSGESSMPLLTMLDGTGAEYQELDKGDGVPNWLGLFRTIQPNGSEGGSIVFDLPGGKGPYKLRLSSGGDIDKEVTALIEVPDEKATPTGGLPAPDGGQ